MHRTFRSILTRVLEPFTKKKSFRLTQIYTDLLEVIDRLTCAAGTKSTCGAVIRLALSICCLLDVMRFQRRPFFFSAALKFVTHNFVKLNKKLALLCTTTARQRGKRATLRCNMDVCHACTGNYCQSKSTWIIWTGMKRRNQFQFFGGFVRVADFPCGADRNAHSRCIIAGDICI